MPAKLILVAFHFKAIFTICMHTLKKSISDNPFSSCEGFNLNAACNSIGKSNESSTSSNVILTAVCCNIGCPCQDYFYDAPFVNHCYQVKSSGQRWPFSVVNLLPLTRHWTPLSRSHLAALAALAKRHCETRSNRYFKYKWVNKLIVIYTGWH